MAIVKDFRTNRGQPALHAFIAGVSRYRHLVDGGGALAKNTFGMPQLKTTAAAAWDFYQWLLQRAQYLPCPLGTVRVLLSPSDDEVSKEPGMEKAKSCTRQEFARHLRDWYNDACTHGEGFALFYFAGHGLARRLKDQLILLEDFGNPAEGTLANAVDVNQIHEALVPTIEALDKTPRTQLFIVDACRAKPANFAPDQTVANILDPCLYNCLDDRDAPIFAPIAGTEAFEIEGEGAAFSARLLKCLRGGGAVPVGPGNQSVPQWAVTVHSLSEALAYEMAELKHSRGIDIRPNVSGSWRKNAILHRLDKPPAVSVSVEVNPADAVPFVDIKILNGANAPVYGPAHLSSFPFPSMLPGGYYRVEAVVNPPHSPYVDYSSETIDVRPPMPRVFSAKVI
jgi:hypothetical protein